MSRGGQKTANKKVFKHAKYITNRQFTFSSEAQILQVNKSFMPDSPINQKF